MRTRSTLWGGDRTRVALLALALSICLLVAAFAPIAALAGTVAGDSNHGGNTTPTSTTTPTPTATPTPTSVPATTVSECRTIDSPGEYRLGVDLVTESGDCLKITASDVSLDGDGHFVTGGPNGAGVAITTGSDGETRNVTVRDLTAKGTSDGVLVSGSENTDDVTGVRLVAVTGHNNSRAGIRTVFANVTISGGTLTENGIGLEMLGGAAVVEGTDARRNQEAGLKVSFGATALTVNGGSFSDNVARGMLVRDVDRATITGATIAGNGFDGITLESTAPNTTLRNVEVADNGRHGIVVRAAGVHVLGSTANGNGGDGFRLPALDGPRDARRLAAGSSTLEAKNNGGAGARLAGSNTTVVGLVATGNRDGIDLSDATGVTVTDADPTDDSNGASASSNDRHGVVLSNTTGSSVDETQIQRNDAAGIRVDASDGNVLASVAVNDNGETFNATGGGTTTVERMAVSNAEISFTTSDIAFNSTVPPANARPGNRTFGPYLNTSTTTGGGGALGGVTGGDGDSGFLDLTVHYPPASVSDPPLVKSTARIHAYDGTWSAVDGSSADPNARTVSANITSPSATYAPAADLENAITSCAYNDWRDGETYRVDTDLSGGGSSCLEVGASDSKLVGFGFGGERPRTVSGSGNSGTVGVSVQSGEANVTVRNLTVSNFGTGIGLASGPEGSTASHTVRRVTVTDSVGTGIVAAGDGIHLTNVSVVDSGGEGVLLDGTRDAALTKLLFLGNGGASLGVTGDTTGTTAENLNLFVDPNRDTVGRNVVVGFGAANEVTLDSIADPPAPGANLDGISDYVDVSRQADDASIQLRIVYDPDTVSDESSLSLYNYDEAAGEYVGVASTTDQDANVVSAELTSFSVFAPLVDTSGSGGGGDTPTPGGGDGDGTPTPTPTPGDGTPTPTPGDGSDGGDGTDGGESQPNVGSGDGTGGSGGGGGSGDSGGSGGGGGGGAGTPQESPSFATTSADVNRTTMRVGETVAISATVRNSGDGGGTYEVDLFRNGDFVQSRFVELVQGEREQISFERRPSSPGTYTFRVENITAGTVNVTAAGDDATTPTPTATPTPAPSPTPGQSDTSGDASDDDGGAGGSGPTADGGSGDSDAQGTNDDVSAPGVPDDGGGFGGLGPLGMVVGGVGALAVGAGAIYLLVLKP